MTLVKWNRGNRTNGTLSESGLPVSTMLPRLFDTFSRPLFSRDLIQDFFDDTLSLGSGAIGTTLPAVNISETDNELVIDMAAPGMKKKNFKVEVNENQLHIGYHHEAEKEDEGTSSWRREYQFQSFDRTFTLPAIVESDKVNASYQDGILRITIQKKEEARRKPSRMIDVK
jgi:HSP20 family protein